jgi:hypothetical protein
MICRVATTEIDQVTGLPGFEDVRAAARRLAGHAQRTPLLAGTPLDARVGGRVLLKLETLQHTGSFKFRGAWNRLCQLTPAQRKAGVVAFSSGNHAQGVAAAAKLLGIPATIVMPADAPAVKLLNTEALGAQVVRYDRQRESREQIAASLAQVRGAVLVPSFDDPDVIAGQGTVGLEILAQADELGLPVDDVIACCSGGGLVAGIALAVHGLSPSTVALWLSAVSSFFRFVTSRFVVPSADGRERPLHDYNPTLTVRRPAGEAQPCGIPGGPAHASCSPASVWRAKKALASARAAGASGAFWTSFQSWWPNL